MAATKSLKLVTGGEAMMEAERSTEELVREAMVACRRAEDALYEDQRDGRRERTSLTGALGSLAFACESHLRVLAKGGV
jgi:hypothetical protein